MDEAKRMAHEGAPGGTVVVAREMTGGRGTHGRGWAAPPGGLYMSLIIRDLEDPHLLTLALGNAVADALEVAGLEPQLKWVNDVWSGGRKVAGILVEGESTGDRIDFLVAGIGINVNGDPSIFPEGLRPTVTTLQADLGAEQCIEDLETLLLQEASRWITLVGEGEERQVLDAWRDRDALKGRQVRVEIADQTLEGTAEGIDARGHLLVEIGDGGIIAVENGTVHLM